ncbi:hypothetical protein QOT17_023511 [Balamuthia mandrillaris]
MYHLLARRRGRSREEAACLVQFHWKRKAKWRHKCRRYEELAAKKEVNDLEEEEKKEWPKLEDHHCLQYAQRSHYLKLAQGEALILQDFTQLKTEAGGFYQDLIIVWFEREADGQLKSHYQHFLTDEKTERSEEGKKTKKRYTADLNFVAGVWETLLESTWKDFKKLIVFSDGCGRQFKCTKHMAWMRSVACDRNLPVDYNFFASNHGYNQCDVIGAQAQRTLVCWELDRGSEGKDARLKVPQDIAAVVSTTKGHKGSVAPTPKKIDKVTTRQGLKDWHRIEYQPDGTLHVWHASTGQKATTSFSCYLGAVVRQVKEEESSLCDEIPTMEHCFHQLLELVKKALHTHYRSYEPNSFWTRLGPSFSFQSLYDRLLVLEQTMMETLKMQDEAIALVDKLEERNRKQRKWP